MRYLYLKRYKKIKKPVVILLSVVSLVLGTLTLLWSFYPIVTFQLSRIFALQELSPLPQRVLASSLQKGLTVYNDSLEPYYSSYLKDFTKVGDWFPKSPQLLTRKHNVKKYTITIPKLGIVNAEVKVGGEDLSKSLVQYGDAVLPGEIGNASILGHSTLPQLYKEKDYKSIFTYLPSVERGDKIKVDINGFIYEYEVYDMFVVEPTDTWVLDPKNDESILTLISCVPPGTYWKRLIVRAKLSGI